MPWEPQCTRRDARRRTRRRTDRWTNRYAPSLVSRTEAGTADWQVDDIVKLLATGIASRGVASGPMAEVVRASLQYLTANDLRAIAVYLKSLPENTAAIAAPLPETSDDMRKQFARGAAVYEKNCEDCHGSSGEGAPAAYPALAANRGVTMRSPLNSIRSVLNGGYPPSTAGIRGHTVCRLLRKACLAMRLPLCCRT